MKTKKIVILFALLSMLSGIFLSLTACWNTKNEYTYKNAAAENTVVAYEKFIRSNPDSPLIEKASQKRDSLIFDSIKTVNTREAYQQFLNEYPNSVFIKQAKKKLKELAYHQIPISTFRGNEQRNYYGNHAPSRLDEIWKFNLGSGKSFAYGKMYVWTGAGWTGQPLLVKEDSATYLIQGAFDYHLRKINAETGKEVWRYKFDDILKGTGTIWKNMNAKNEEEKYIIMQGSRRGEGIKGNTVSSFRAVSYLSGKELWRFNSRKTRSYSRDVDGSALTLGDTAYIGLENGIFMVFDPNPTQASMREGMLQPKVIQELKLYDEKDIQTHGGNLVTESSPTYFNGRIYVTTGSGHVYGYNLKTKEIDWDFYIGADMDGSPAVTDDSCLIVTLEKEYIKGKGGTYKLDPSKAPDDAVVWFYPTGNKSYFTWKGGIIGSAAVNDAYVDDDANRISAFLGMDGYIHVVNHQKLSNLTVPDHNNENSLPTPELVFKDYVGPGITSPIIVENRMVVATYQGLYLYEFDENLNFKLLDKMKGTFEASPIVWDKKVYIASNSTGFLYCLGEK